MKKLTAKHSWCGLCPHAWLCLGSGTWEHRLLWETRDHCYQESDERLEAGPSPSPASPPPPPAPPPSILPLPQQVAVRGCLWLPRALFLQEGATCCPGRGSKPMTSPHPGCSIKIVTASVSGHPVTLLSFHGPCSCSSGRSPGTPDPPAPLTP